MVSHPKRDEYSAGFGISTWPEDMIEQGCEEHFGPRAKEYGDTGGRRKFLRAKLINQEGGITPKGWEKLNADVMVLERNALQWLRETFAGARDDGHDNHGDLIGDLWFDPTNQRHLELLETGAEERIDMVDSSFGDLSNTVWKGVSPFGQAVLGGEINFFDVPERE
jgi:hypothetical protein